MEHLDEGTLAAIRDGEGTKEAERHLETCVTCRRSLQALQRRGGLVAGSLSQLDEPFDAGFAREAVRTRVSAGSARRRTARRLGRAAGVLLFLGAAGAAYAMPGSPVRSWLARRGDAGKPQATVEATQTAPAASAAKETAVRMDLGPGPARIVLRGVRAGTAVEVTLVRGTTAAVTAPRGTRFATSRGWIEADVAPGTVLVELPRDVVPATLEVAGRVYLRNTDAGVQIPGPAGRHTDGSIRFTVPKG